MRNHILKCHPQYFHAVKDGSKNFEFRNNDRGFKVDDVVILREYDPITSLFSGDEIFIKITYILDDFIGMKQGWCVFSFKRIDNLSLDD